VGFNENGEYEKSDLIYHVLAAACHCAYSFLTCAAMPQEHKLQSPS
jgi:hypothetical protein